MESVPSKNEIEADEQVLVSRAGGASFAKIATECGLTDSRDALAAFKRAVGRKSAKEQASIRANERKRFDAMARKIKANTELSAEEAAVRLTRIAKLRAALG